MFDSWQTATSWRPFKNFIMLREGTDANQVKARFPAFEVRYLGEEIASSVQFHLQPVNRIRHYANVDYGMKADRGIHFIYRLGLIGMLILVIACVNFMNLATAQSTRRAREVGLRKVVGAGRGQLMGQFLGEAGVLAGAALVLAYMAAQLSLPYFNDFMQVNLTFTHSARLNVALVGLALLVGLSAGGYPAFFLPHFQPVEILKGKLSGRGSARGMRRCLVVLQFAIAGTLIFAAIVVYQQTEYMNQKDLGYDQRLLINMPVSRYEVSASFEVMKRAFGDHANVLGVTASHPTPGSWNGAEYHAVRPEGEAEGEWEMQVIGIDADFLSTFGMELVAGRNLYSNREQDRDAFLLNETAVRQLGWDEPIGKRLDWLGEKSGYVVAWSGISTPGPCRIPSSPSSCITGPNTPLQSESAAKIWPARSPIWRKRGTDFFPAPRSNTGSWTRILAVTTVPKNT